MHELRAACSAKSNKTSGVKMKLNKLLGATIKAGGSAACGFSAFVLAGFAGKDPGAGNSPAVAALIAGLGGSSLILAGQAASDVVGAFKSDPEE